MTAFKDLGAALVELRMDRRRNQREVAEAAGITKAMLSSYENDRTSPNVETLGRVLDALGAGPAELSRALRAARAGPGPPRRPGEFQFGPEERELVAELLERTAEVLDRVLIPWLRSSGERPDPDDGSPE